MYLCTTTVTYRSGGGTMEGMYGLMCAVSLMASTTYPIATILPTPPPSPAVATTSIPTMIERFSDFYGVNREVMSRVIKCESGYNPNAEGDHGTSFGLSQIHLPAHPDITKEQALDPEFAIKFMAKEMSQGNSWKWTCWKMIYGPLSTTYPQKK